MKKAEIEVSGPAGVRVEVFVKYLANVSAADIQLTVAVNTLELSLKFLSAATLLNIGLGCKYDRGATTKNIKTTCNTAVEELSFVLVGTNLKISTKTWGRDLPD